MKSPIRFWSYIFIIWIIATLIDRHWWHTFSGIPSWDQADYLNSALEHGQALGIIPNGHWEGFKALLDLSPKIPPMGSLVNGVFIAIAGDSPQAAAWSLSFWHGVLLIGIAGWGRHLGGQKLAIISAFFVAIAPGLFQLRTDYVLEMPLTACVTIALWQLGIWANPKEKNTWTQTSITIFALAMALLIKQSALLFLFPAIIWVIRASFKAKENTKAQLLVASSLVILSLLPWLHHNWITIIGGTNRAVFESAVKEGDPYILDFDNWIWYLRVIPKQIGLGTFILGIGGLLILYFRRKEYISKVQESKNRYFPWIWLSINLVSGWIIASIVPNKDIRYITPILPLVIIYISLGWIQWFNYLQDKLINKGNIKVNLIAITGLIAALLPEIIKFSLFTPKPYTSRQPLEDIIQRVNYEDPENHKKTIIVIPSTPDLNQHNVSYYGRRKGGNILGRQLGSKSKDIEPILDQAKWIILAEGNQGSVRKSARLIDKKIRESNYFQEIQRFPRPNNAKESYSLWIRTKAVSKKKEFSIIFPLLAKDLSKGVEGIEKVFSTIETQHMIDGHFKYKEIVQRNALVQLNKDPDNLEARWTMTLLAILANRPNEADKHLLVLEDVLPDNPWPSIYRSVVNLANWNPWKAEKIAKDAYLINRNSILGGIIDISGILGGKLWKIPSAFKSIPKASNEIELLSKKQ